MLLQGQQTGGQDRGHSFNFSKPIEIDQTVQSSFTNAAYLMENYILKSSEDLGLGCTQLPGATLRPETHSLVIATNFQLLGA